MTEIHVVHPSQLTPYQAKLCCYFSSARFFGMRGDTSVFPLHRLEKSKGYDQRRIYVYIPNIPEYDIDRRVELCFVVPYHNHDVGFTFVTEDSLSEMGDGTGLHRFREVTRKEYKAIQKCIRRKEAKLSTRECIVDKEESESKSNFFSFWKKPKRKEESAVPCA